MPIDYDQLIALDNHRSYATVDGSSIFIEWRILTESEAVGEHALLGHCKLRSLSGFSEASDNNPLSIEFWTV
jgi:hypothetical protein